MGQQPEAQKSPPALLVAVNNGARRYNGRLSMLCPSFQLMTGETVAFIGPNGAGKSTCLRVLAGITPLSSGSMEKSPHWRGLKLAYLPQIGGLFGDLSVEDNIAAYRRAFGQASLHGLDRSLIEETQLGKLFQTRAQYLSGGYAKICSLVCIFSVKADVLLLDEPSAEIGAQHLPFVVEAIKQSRSFYQAVVLAEHLAEVISVADRSHKFEKVN